MGSKRYRNLKIVQRSVGTFAVRKCMMKRNGEYVVANREAVEVDHMPKQVATEMLLAPKVKLTNRQRKTYLAARWNVFRSTLSKTPREVKLAIRLQGSTWAQLDKWLTRCNTRRALVQAAYTKGLAQAQKFEPVEGDSPETASKRAFKRVILQRVLAGLDMKANLLDEVIDGLESEVTRRKEFIAKLHSVTPEVAAKVEAGLCPTNQN